MRNIRKSNRSLLVSFKLVILNLLLLVSFNIVNAEILSIDELPGKEVLDCSRAVQLIIDYRHLDFIYSYRSAEEYLDNYFMTHKNDSQSFIELKEFVYLHSRDSDNPDKIKDVKLHEECDVDSFEQQTISKDLFVWLY